MISSQQAKKISLSGRCVGDATKQMMSVNDHRALKTLSIIMGVFILCWLPFCFILPMQAFCTSCTTDALYYSVIWIGYINSVCNPILYSKNPEFMSAYKQLLSCHIVHV